MSILSELRLNLGCSDDLKPGYVNVDQCGKVNMSTYGNIVYQDNCVYSCRLANTWPLYTSTVNEIYAKDIFEHIDNAEFPGNKGKIWVLNESYRVLRPNGILELIVPCVYLRDGRVNPGAFADPTHVSFWTYDDRYYFCKEWNNKLGERGRLGPAYGITAVFDPIKWDLEEYGAGHERRSKIHAVLRAVK